MPGSTIDANEQLGYDADERVYLPAAEMLRQLGYINVRLLITTRTRSWRCSARIGRRAGACFHARPQRRYLATKATRSRHFFSFAASRRCGSSPGMTNCVRHFPRRDTGLASAEQPVPTRTEVRRSGSRSRNRRSSPC